MKKLYTLFILCTFGIVTSYAQMANGSVVPNFVGTDLNGNTYELYDLLDQGKSVVIDVSATWCGPCWSYHETKALEDLYNNFGPNGTDEMMVLWIEGDANTNTDCIYNLPGCNSSTVGDWTAGTSYPIIDDAEIAEVLEISYYPTIYHVCSNRIITEAGQVSEADLYALHGTCPEAIGENNAGILNYTGFQGEFCEDVAFSPSVQVQNMGNANMTSMTAELWLNGEMEESMDWEGELAKFSITELNFTEINVSIDTELEIRVVNVNGVDDEDMSNNAVAGMLSIAKKTAENLLTLEIKTDSYPGETYWEIKSDDGILFYAGGNDRVLDVNNNGFDVYTDTETSYITKVALPADGCFEFTIYDSYGDGICCTEGFGYYRLTDSQDNLIAEGGDFTDEDRIPFGLEGAGVIENNGSIVNFDGTGQQFCDTYIYSPTIEILNMGANDITSASIEIYRNDVLDKTVDWTGMIASGTASEVQLDDVEISETSNISLKIVEINNELDEQPYGNSKDISFTRNVSDDDAWSLELQLDSYGYECYWHIADEDGNVIAYGGNENIGPDGGGAGGADPSDPGAYAASALIMETIDLGANGMNGCYEFRLVDSYGDGLVDGGGGYVKLTDSNGNIIIDKDMSATPYSTDLNTIDLQLSPVGVGEIDGLENVELFPNPASEIITVQLDLDASSELTFRVLNILGQEMKSFKSIRFSQGRTQYSVPLDGIESGQYFLQIANDTDYVMKRFTAIK